MSKEDNQYVLFVYSCLLRKQEIGECFPRKGEGKIFRDGGEGNA